MLRAEANSEEAALAFLLGARDLGTGLGPGVELFDPVPALMLRIAGRHRLQLLLQSANRPACKLQEIAVDVRGTG